MLIHNFGSDVQLIWKLKKIQQNKFDKLILSVDLIKLD